MFFKNYHGISFISLVQGEASYAECLVTRAGEIVHVGSLAQAEQLAGARREVDLGGGCLMPGFIDPHIHPSMAGQWYEVFKSLPNAVFVITEKAPTRAFSWLKAATTAFTFKTLCKTGVDPTVSQREIGSTTQLS